MPQVLSPQVLSPQVLLIDDEPQVRASLMELLELNRFSVAVAANGRAGVELAQAQVPDIVVCDIHMPELDGYGVLTELRAQAETALVPVIFLTAKGDYASLRQGMKLGADDYLAKPVEPQELVAAINAQLEKRSQLSRGYLAQLHYPAPENIDAVTGLPNLLALEAQFNQATPAPCHRLTLFKLNNYPQLQESFGHVFGTRVLQVLAERLQRWQGLPVKGVAYVGSERFVLLTELANDIDEVPPDLQRALSASICINNQVIEPDLLWRTTPVLDGDDFNQCLLRVMKLPTTFQTNVREATLSNAWATRLQQALKNNEFELYYQPQVDLKTGQVLGAEVLLRWHSPDGPVPPAVFIPAAEETDLIGPIWDWVLENACKQLRHWHTSEMFAITLAINLSAKQLQQPGFQQQLLQTVKQYCVSPALIDLELTESVLISQPEGASQMFEELQAAGFSIAIDDFGTGYSSLGYLQQLPVNILKIDKCFVRNLDKNEANRVIVKAITEMAHGLNISTLAEGVETPEELMVLQQLNCETMQGYLYSQPLSATDFEQLICAEKDKRRLIVDSYSVSHCA
ncbi:MAG: EAL domain-containing protein [Cyanobacteria bacterium P01_A01_bin.105]